MKHERLIAILDCLLNEGKKTAAELSARFEVSERTVYRDIDSLCVAGVPVCAEAGTGGGYSIDPAYRVDRSFLTRDELRDLTGLLSGFSDTLKDERLARSLGKLSSLGGGRPGAAGPPPPIMAAPSPWGAPEPDPSAVLSVRRAITERRVVSFSYRDAAGEASERRVEPFTLALLGPAWYLHGYCLSRDDWRLFKLSRMSGVRILADRYDPESRLPAPALGSGWDEEFTAIRLAAEPRAARALLEAVPEAVAEEAPGGGTVLSFEYPAGSWLVRFLLGFGPGVRVLEPDSLRAALRDAALGIADANCQ